MSASPVIDRLALLHHMSESDALQEILPGAQLSAAERSAAQADALDLVQALRARQIKAAGVDALMRQFSLSTQEGVALMCLAEALLRVPDSATVDELIRDKLAQGDWQSHTGQGASLFVNAAAWGLVLAGRVLKPLEQEGLSPALGRLLARGGEPLIRQSMAWAMRLLGDQFVTGRTIAEALSRAQPLRARGYRHSFDMLGEAALTAEDALRYTQAYAQAIEAVGPQAQAAGVRESHGLSIKLSALHPRYHWSQANRVRNELLPRLLTLCVAAKRYNIGLNIDAEETDRLLLSLELLEALLNAPELAGWDGLGFVIQAYQKRAVAVVDHVVALARRAQRRLMIRLVKGAYWDSEIKRAQVEGWTHYPVWTRKVHTDVSYLACAARLLQASDVVYAQFATHNAYTVAAIEQLAARHAPGTAFEFQCLHGMGEPLYDHWLAKRGSQARVRIYAPVGSHETLLAYLVRRLLENGANSSFVHQLVDDQIPAQDLVRDPAEQVLAEGGLPHPRIPLPRQLYGKDRLNSAGLDLSDPQVREALLSALKQNRQINWQAEPMVAGVAEPMGAELAKSMVAGAAKSMAAGVAKPMDERPAPLEEASFFSFTSEVRNPANPADRVGQVRSASASEVRMALEAASSEQAKRWAQTPVAERAACLRRAADQMEQEQPMLMALLVREAGKSWSAALAEVREAVDFLRYYAAQAEVQMGDMPMGEGAFTAAESPSEYVAKANPSMHTSQARVQPLGPVVCISPWNFPLAIFTGQVAAALVCGNSVLAKPAEQTPLVAAQAIRILHTSGIPAAALQLLPGDGESVGAALVADPRVQAVLFTGSTAVARLIQRQLAEQGRNTRLIAETGGQNAMIVDSTALTEQVVLDVLASSFDSAGQRCSALRVLCLQEEIADRTLQMLRGALAEWRVGDPAHFETDFGPVIDVAAAAQLEGYVRAAQARGLPVQRPLSTDGQPGYRVAPAIIELASLADLSDEQFGPILHVLRFSAAQRESLLDQIHALGYGLTLGVHSRIEHWIERVTQQAQIGNVYVNRNMIGAVVGVQPFGGEGLSGTGPKAGGPLYLQRLVRGGAFALPASCTPAPMPQPLADLIAWMQRREHCDDPTRPVVEPVLKPVVNAWSCPALAGACLPLPGPTGEENTLRWVPKGRVAAVAHELDAGLHQAAAALAQGNRICVETQHPLAAVWPQLPATVQTQIDRVADLRTEPWSALLIDAPAKEARQWRCWVAEQPGPIRAVLVPEPHYDYTQLVHERTTTINTAAAGGNASLMAQAS